MTRAACAALSLAVATAAHADPQACLALAGVPDGPRLATVVPAAPGGTFAITYVHSVTHTLVVETYRIDGHALVQTSIEFTEHGPGLPTAPDPGQSWRDVDGRFVVTLDRRFESIRMRVHRDQSPRLVVGARSVDLARWGNRPVVLGVSTCRDASE